MKNFNFGGKNFAFPEDFDFFLNFCEPEFQNVFFPTIEGGGRGVGRKVSLRRRKSDTFYKQGYCVFLFRTERISKDVRQQKLFKCN